MEAIKKKQNLLKVFYKMKHINILKVAIWCVIGTRHIIITMDIDKKIKFKTFKIMVFVQK